MRWPALVLLFLIGSYCARAHAEVDGYAFTIMRGDSPIGTHYVAFTRAGDLLTVDMRTEIAVKIVFVTVYRYSQHTRQVWKNGRLQSLDTRTDDNGETRRVQAQATAAGLAVDAPHGRFLAPGDTMPTGYWNREIVNRAQALDSHGKLVGFAAAPAGARIVHIDGRAVEAQIYRISGAADGEVGYAQDGSWVSLALNERGNTITYLRDRRIDPK